MRQAFLPAVEIPLYTDMDGKPLFINGQTAFIGLYSATLKISFGFSSFEVIEPKSLGISKNSDSCHAKFSPETGRLDIPQINVPTLVFMANQIPVSGPVVKCRTSLQQSIVRIDILELTKFDCAL